MTPEQKRDPQFQARLQELARASISPGAPAESARKELATLLGFDALNLSYFLALYQAKMNPRPGAGLQIFETGRQPDANRLVAYPTAIATEEMLKHLPYVDYAELTRSPKNYAAAARRATLWLKKMQAGTGSSMTRSRYKAKMLGIPESEVRIGAKGTDLYADVPDPRGSGQKVQISLVEAQLLQSLHDARKGVFGGIVLHDLVSSETQSSLRAVWKKRTLADPAKTYEELVAATPGIEKFRETFQSYLPTLDSELRVTLAREAPGGHALFAVDSLRAAFLKDQRPDPKGLTLVSSVGNGEDLSSTPDATMVGWMVEERVPIAMITTEKTPNDLKGGQIALVTDREGRVYTTIIEKAQAEETGQLKLFEDLGLSVKRDAQIAFFNTNMVLYNYDALTPIVEGIVKELGEQGFMQVIAPDLVDNWKEQKDPDGVKRKYLQLEGATASSLLNLDRWYRARHGKPLVHIVNVDRMNRTKFFSPIKSAFDYFMQFHSDLFSLEPESMRLTHHRPGTLPSVSLKADPAKHYEDVSNVLDAFEGSSIRELDSLAVEGLVVARGVKLKGAVKIVNQGKEPAELARLRSEFAGTEFVIPG